MRGYHPILKVGVLIASFGNHAAFSQQVITSTIPSTNFAPLVIQGERTPNVTFDPAGFNANALGQSLATGTASVAIGASSSAQYSASSSYTLPDVLEYTAGAVATGNRSVALGSGQGGDTFVSMGLSTGPDPQCRPYLNPQFFCSIQSTVVLGAAGDDSIAIGTKAFAEKDSSTAIGKDAQANIVDGVAVGSRSVSGAAHTGDYTINGGTIAATTANGNSFSVGASNFERQIQNVAAGVVSATSTDAVNGSQLYAVGTKVNQNTTAITQNTTDIAKNTADISTLDTTVTAQGVAITQNTTNIAKNTTDIATLDTTVTAQGIAIGQNTTNIAKNTTDIATLDTTVTAQGVAIGQNTTNIAKNTADITKNTADISTLDTTVTAQGIAITQNTTDIAKNTADISTLDTTVTAQGVAITQNTTNIAKNTTDITKNTADISTLDTTVTAQGIAIGQNTTNIAKNTTDIAKNTTDISKNTADISTLDTTVTAQGIAIGQNTTNIAKNTTNIAKNTADIATLDTTVTAQGVAIGQNTTNIAKNTADINTLGTTTAAALGGGASYTSNNGISAPNYAIQGRTYNDVGSALSALDNNMTNNLTNMQGQINTLSAGYLGHSQEINGLKQSVQRGYEGTAVTLATAGGNFLQESQKFSVTGKFGSFRGQYGMGAVAQARLNQNVVAHAGVGGGVRYGGVGAFGGLTVGW